MKNGLQKGDENDPKLTRKCDSNGGFEVEFIPKGDIIPKCDSKGDFDSKTMYMKNKDSNGATNLEDSNGDIKSVKPVTDREVLVLNKDYISDLYSVKLVKKPILRDERFLSKDLSDSNGESLLRAAFDFCVRKVNL